MSDATRFSLTDITVSDLLRHEPYDENGKIMLVLASAYDALLAEKEALEIRVRELEAALTQSEQAMALVGHNEICSSLIEFPDPDLPCDCSLACALALARKALVKEARDA